MSGVILRFNGFTLDPGRYELRRAGRNAKLERIPFDLLILLIEKRDRVVSREEIAARLWGEGVVQDTEQGINTAVRKIRMALRDDAERPRFVQTVAGRGYRFIAPVVVEDTAADGAPPPAAERPPRPRGFGWAVWAGAGVFLFAAAYWGFTRDSATVSRDRIMLAVLPFANLSGDPSQEYFSDGMTEEMITELARLNPDALGVIARTSVMRYKNAPPAIDEIGKQLGVDYVLEGSARKEGDNVRITAQLIRVRDQTHLWAQTYDRGLRSAPALQTDVARAIAAEFRLGLSSEQRESLARNRPVDPAAYDAYLKGRFFWNRRSEEDLTKAITLFQEAIDRDPASALGYSGIADCYAALAYGNYLAPTDAFAKARVAVGKARERDPTAAELDASEGYLQMYFDWNFPAAEESFRKAIARNPNYATAHHWLGMLLTALGRFDEAGAQLKGALHLDPLSAPIQTDTGFYLHYSSRNAEAVTALEEALVLNPRFAFARFWLARVHGAEGRCEQAFAEFNAIGPAFESWQPSLAAKGYLLGRCGDRKAAAEMLDRFHTLSQTRYATSYGVALVHAGLGDRAQALAWLDKAHDERTHWMVWLGVDPRWSEIRQDPRFLRLLRRVGLA